MEADESIVTSEADEKRAEERMSVVATFGILIATIAATLAGTFAALSSFRADGADSQREAWATYSNEMLLGYNQYDASMQQNRDINVENGWRNEFLSALASEETVTDPTLSAELWSEYEQDARTSDAAGATKPTFSSPGPAPWCRVVKGESQAEPYDCAYEVASAYATTSLDDNLQERAYVACVSMLAIALFLFALSKMLSQPSMEKLFLGLGASITLVAVCWMVAEPLLTPAPSPSGSAIRSYERGWQLELKGRRPATVEALLRAATSAEPSLADAWQELGNEELFDPVGGKAHPQCSSALAALTRAWDLRGAPDDRDHLAVGETLCGQPAQALSALRAAPPDHSDVLDQPADALALLASDRLGPALRSLDGAVCTMEHQGDGLRGSVYRLQWFDQLFTEVQTLHAVDPHLADVNRFTEAMEHQEALATLTDFGFPAPARAPHAWVRISTELSGEVVWGVAPVHLVLDYSGLHDGDVVLVVWHDANSVESDRFVDLSLPNTSLVVVGQPGGPPAGTGTFILPTVDFVTTGSSYLQLDVSLDAVPSGLPKSVPVYPSKNVSQVAMPASGAEPTILPPPTTTTTTTTTIPRNTTTTTTPATTTTTTFCTTPSTSNPLPPGVSPPATCVD